MSLISNGTVSSQSLSAISTPTSSPSFRSNQTFSTLISTTTSSLSTSSISTGFPQITPAANKSSLASSGSLTNGVLVTAFNPSFHPYATLTSDFTFEPIQWLGDPATLTAAKSCWSAITSWNYDAQSYFSASVFNKSWPITTSTVTTTYTRISTTTIYPTEDISVYTLCDGSPRVNAKPVTRTLTSSTVDTTQSWVVTASATYPSPVPCQPDQETCYDWYRYSNATNDWDEDDTFDGHLLMAECGQPAAYDPRSTNLTDWPCEVRGRNVQLYYFPVDTGNQSSCNANRTTVHPSAITPPASVATIDGHTFTSGNVYVSFDTIFAYYAGFQQYRIGTTFTNYIMTLASADISTNCGGNNGIGTRMNYADLNYPVPASAYNCQKNCNNPFAGTPIPAACSTIWDNFNPVMAIPTQVLDLHPAWKSCALSGIDGPGWLNDPPSALTQITSDAQPTLPHPGIITSAAPSPSPNSPTSLPDQTSPPQPPQSPQHTPSALPASKPENPQPSPTPGKSNPTSVNQNPGPSGSQPDQSPAHPSPAAPASPDPEPDTHNPTPPAAPPPSRTTVTLEYTTLTLAPLDPNTIAVGTHTLTPGQVTTLPGAATVSVAAPGVVVINHSQTISLPPPPPASPSSPPNDPSIFAAGPSLTVTAIPAPGTTGALVVDGQTLSIGGPATTVDGQTVSLASSGLVVVSGSRTGLLTAVPGNPSASETEVLAASGLTVTAVRASESGGFVVGGTTLVPGGKPMTVDGVTVSDVSGSLVEVGSRTTVTLSAVSTVEGSGTSTGSSTGAAASTTGNVDGVDAAQTSPSAAQSTSKKKSAGSKMGVPIVVMGMMMGLVLLAA